MANSGREIALLVPLKGENEHRVFAKVLLEDQRKLGSAFIMEGEIMAKHLFRASYDSLDSIARVSVSAIALHRHTWLCLSALFPETKSKVEDLLFKGDGLFSN